MNHSNNASAIFPITLFIIAAFFTGCDEDSVSAPAPEPAPAVSYTSSSVSYTNLSSSETSSSCISSSEVAISGFSSSSVIEQNPSSSTPSLNATSSSDALKRFHPPASNPPKQKYRAVLQHQVQQEQTALPTRVPLIQTITTKTPNASSGS